MKHHWPKIIEWSEVDQAYIGSIPGLVGACCHGDDERAVLEELCQIQQEVIATLMQEHDGLPPSLPPLYMLNLTADHPLLRDLDPKKEIATTLARFDKRHEQHEAGQSLIADTVQEDNPDYASSPGAPNPCT